MHQRHPRGTSGPGRPPLPHPGHPPAHRNSPQRVRRAGAWLGRERVQAPRSSSALSKHPAGRCVEGGGPGLAHPRAGRAWVVLAGRSAPQTRRAREPRAGGRARCSRPRARVLPPPGPESRRPRSPQRSPPRAWLRRARARASGVSVCADVCVCVCECVSVCVSACERGRRGPEAGAGGRRRARAGGRRGGAGRPGAQGLRRRPPPAAAANGGSAYPGRRPPQPAPRPAL